MFRCRYFRCRHVRIMCEPSEGRKCRVWRDAVEGQNTCSGMGDHFKSAGKPPEPQICIVTLRAFQQAAAANTREMTNVLTLIRISNTAVFIKNVKQFDR